MMIRVAMIGYDRDPEFRVTASEIPPLDERIAWAMLSRPVFRHACAREGINPSLAMRICGVKRSEFEAMKRENDDREDGKLRVEGKGKIERRGNWLGAWRAKL